MTRSIGSGVVNRRAASKHAVSFFGPWGVVALLLALAMGCAITVGTDRAGVARPIGFFAGLAVAVLAVGGLPSFPKRSVVIGVLGLGGFVLVRHLQISTADGMLVIGFIVFAIVAIALADRITKVESIQLSDQPVKGWAPFARSAAGAVALVLLFGAVAAPFVSRAMHQDIRRGDESDPFSDASSSAQLSLSREMDTRRRPRLSNKIVMTVKADRPSFWRGTTFDAWDGQTWTRSGETRAVALLRGQSGWNDVDPSPEDPAVDNGVVNKQTFTMRAEYATMLFAAPSPVRVKSDRYVGQLPDGSLVVSQREAFGKGATYTIESRMPNATVEKLRAAPDGPLPTNVETISLDPGVISDRVQQLAESITATETNAYDKTQAIIRWLGTNTKYSLDAPLPPSDSRDTVDHFLFTSKLGWCEQISSSLAVMLRAVGVPARIATGYITGDADRLTGQYTVREKHAHAWTEVYFPGIGWQGFDPTASVPLGGVERPDQTLFDWLVSHAVVTIGLVVAVVGLMFGLPWCIRRWRARVRRSQVTWAAQALRDLERLGAKHDRPRGSTESPAAYGRALSVHLERADLVEVGAAIDASAFGPPP